MATATPPTATTSKPIVSDEQKTLYHEEGYMILENVIPPDMLQMLKEECSYAIGYKDAEMDAKGIKVDGITHRGSRYFIGQRYRESQRLWKFLFSDLMAEICRATLGDTAYLFHEQWVVKGADQGMQFAWHQDSGYVTHNDPNASSDAYLTCWCALDDMTEENGTAYILPHSRGGTKSGVVDHTQQEITNDLVGYTGDDPGIPAIVPAGSIVCFTSHTLHRSSSNNTPNMRRVYLGQYSDTIIRASNGKPWGLATPFLKDGKNIYNHESDTA